MPEGSAGERQGEPVASSAASDSTGLIVASVVNGLAAYGFAALGLRVFGPERFAPVAIVWSIWALAVAATTFPLQHWINWRARDRQGIGLGASDADPHRRVRAGGVARYGRHRGFDAPASQGDRRMDRSHRRAGVDVGSAGFGGGGVLAAKGDYRGVAVAIGGENLARLVIGSIVVAVGGGVLAFGWALAAGPLVLLPLLGRLGTGPAGVRVPILSGLGGLTVAVLVAQVFVQLSPLAAEWLDADADSVSAVFATFALFRAPVLMGLAAVTRLTTPFTTMFVERPDGPAPQAVQMAARSRCGRDAGRLCGVRRAGTVADPAGLRRRDRSQLAADGHGRCWHVAGPHRPRTPGVARRVGVDRRGDDDLGSRRRCGGSDRPHERRPGIGSGASIWRRRGTGSSRITCRPRNPTAEAGVTPLAVVEPADDLVDDPVGVRGVHGRMEGEAQQAVCPLSLCLAVGDSDRGGYPAANRGVARSASTCGCPSRTYPA